MSLYYEKKQKKKQIQVLVRKKQFPENNS